MKKFLYLFMTIFVVISLSGCGKENKKTILNKLNKKVNNVSGYKLDAQMELINNDDSYKYDVTVSYKKDNNYRVSLRNKTNNHEQIILKNDDGVYVLTPALNKSFKFQSKWPYNNSQSYLIQSVINDLKNDTKLSMTKVKSGYMFKSTVNYKNNRKLTYQKVLVDKNMNIKNVVVYDDSDNAQIKVTFTSIDMRAKFKNNYFEIDENMNATEESKKENSDEVESQVNTLDEALYPMYLPEDTYLETEKVVEIDDGSRIILTFSGESPFMLVEEVSTKNDEMEIIPASGDLDIISGVIAIIGDTSVSWSNENIDYYLVSSELSTEELVNVAKSIASMPISK